MKTYLIIAGVALLVVGALLLQYKRQEKQEQAITSEKLKPDVKEKIIIDGLRKKLTVINDKGTKLITLPDRPATIELLKGGDVRITAPQHGFQRIFFIGIGYSNQLNNYVGLDLYYWKQLDIGTAFSFDRSLKVKEIGFPIMLSYTVYHRLRLSIGLEPFGEHRVHGLVSVRI